jgi:hypothetical protein
MTPRDDLTHLRDAFRKLCICLIPANADLFSSFSLVSFDIFVLSFFVWHVIPLEDARERAVRILTATGQERRGGKKNGRGLP